MAFIFEWNSTLQHAVADVDQAGAGVLSARRARVGRRALGFFSCLGGWRVALGVVGVGRCELGDCFERRPGLERPELPAESPAHRLVDVVARIGDLAGDLLRVTRASGRAWRAGRRRPCPYLRYSARMRAAVGSIDRAASSDGSFGGCFGRYSSVCRSSVRISSPHLLVEPGAGLGADQAALDHRRSTNGGSVEAERRARRARGRRRRRCRPCGTSRSSAGRSPAR